MTFTANKMDCIKSFVRIIFQAIHPQKLPWVSCLRHSLIHINVMSFQSSSHNILGRGLDRVIQWTAVLDASNSPLSRIDVFEDDIGLNIPDSVLDAGCHAIRQGDAGNTPFCSLGHSSDKCEIFWCTKKLLGQKKWGNCVVFSQIWISTALAVEETSVLAYNTVHWGFEQHCATMSLFDANLFVILLIQLQKSRDWQVSKMVEACHAVSVLLWLETRKDMGSVIVGAGWPSDKQALPNI